MKELPHIKQDMSDFPRDNTRVYQQYANDFDYSAYADTYTIFKPCNVRWTNTDNNRVYWENNTKRDEFFDDIAGSVHTVPYQSGMNIVTGEEIKLPIPYQALQQYNYLMVQIPHTPVANNNMKYDRFYYFILDARYASPSVSYLTLELDYYTTYQHAVEIPRIELERGHHAMTYATPEKFLSNPIDNNTGLCDAEPFEPQLSNIVSHGEFVPLGAGRLYCLMAMRCTLNDMRDWVKAGSATASTPPTYSDTTDYYGKQYTVNGYRWATPGDYSHVGTPIQQGTSNDLTRPNGYTVIACAANDLAGMFGMFARDYPQFYTSVEAIYIVPMDFVVIDTDNAVTFNDYVFYNVHANTNSKITDITLNKDYYGYPSEYANITKLYTTPYAALQLTDTTTNNSAVFEIQQCSNSMQISRKVSIAYPYINAMMYMSGYGTNVTLHYQWSNLRDTSIDSIIPQSDYNFIKNYDIPTYTLLVENSLLYYMDNYSQNVTIARNTALNAYYNSVQSTNTSAYNTAQSNNTNKTNTQNLINKNTTASINSADTALANTEATNTTVKNNTIASTNTASTILKNSNDTIANNNDYYTTKVQSTRGRKRTKMINDVIRSESASALMSQNASDTSMIGQAISTVGGVIGGAVTGASIGGGVGAVVGTVGGAAINLAQAAATSYVGVSKNMDAIASLAAINESAGNEAMDLNNYVEDVALVIQATNIANTNNTNEINQNLQNTNTINNTNAAVDTSNANAKRSRDISVTNTTSVNQCKIDNNNRSYDTNNANNTRSQDSNIMLAKRNLDIAQQHNDAKLADLRRSRSAKICTESGSPISDLYAQNGILVRLITQPQSVIKKCGDQFLKYGYTYNENIENIEFLLKRKYTYWQGKAEIYSIDAPLNAVNEIRELFANGLTLWRSNDMIGSSIYDND